MMEDTDTDSLRKLAPCWSLAGDERLLTILQNTHQRLITKCQEANTQLEQMATALDDANISLQNVNNQFMALSSSQFVERRVYDDDADITTEPPVTKESPKLSPPDELSILKRSIAVIESNHEVITILQESDTDSDTDDELPDRLVMKPRDMYAERPLPYIIGSEPWKNKWHAGLIRSDSDTDSTTSKVDRESDQYSQSEPEDFEPINRTEQNIPIPQNVRQISESSSESPLEATPDTKKTPADVASEIARRLGGGDITTTVVEDTEYDAPKPAIKKIYKPQEPISSTIFPDEPPPLDNQTDSDSDIFADLHRNQPYNQTYKQTVSDQLFGETEGDIFSDFAKQPKTAPVSLFEAGPTPHMFDKQLQQRADREANNRNETNNEKTEKPVDDVSVKKPIGGISLFGSNKGAESIGAAILKRNRRKSNSSSDESEIETASNLQKTEKSPSKDQNKKEKDIFDDLFAKSAPKKVTPKPNNIAKAITQEIQKKKEEKTQISKPVDLFSDNLFDDIDDIFTTNVVKDTMDKKKSIFDDDDLFSEVADVKPAQQNIKSDKKPLFDSDDDLFTEKVVKDKPNVTEKPVSVAKTNIKTNDVKNIPDTATKIPDKNNDKETTNAALPSIKKGAAINIFDDDDDDIFTNISKKENPKVENKTIIGTAKNINKSNVFKSPSLFGDDDDDDSDLFTDNKSKNIQKQSIDKVYLDTEPVKDNIVIEKDNVEQSNEAPKPIIEDKISDQSVPDIVTTVSKKTEPKSIKPTDPGDIDITEDVENNVIQNTPIKNIAVKKLEAKKHDLDDIKETKIASEYKSDLIYNINKNAPNDVNFEDNATKTSADVFENITVNKDALNINTQTEQITKFVNNATLNTKEELDEETFKENVSEISNNKSTDVINNVYINTPKDSFKETIPEEPDDLFLEKDIFPASNNVSNLEKTESVNKEYPENNITSDILSDIISEPPDFEKPKEPKKSKNVNALFDDDSDDEALFFKRDDIVTDEKPEDFTVKQDRLFDMFSNEPPDEEFTNNDEDLFSTLPRPKLPKEQPVFNSNSKTVDSNKSTLNEAPPAVDDIKINNQIENTDDPPTYNSNIVKSVSFEESSSIFDSNETLNSEKRLPDIKDDDDDELFKSLPVQLPRSNTQNIRRYDENTDEIFTSLPPNLYKETPNNTLKPSSYFQTPSESLDSKSEIKKVGKLKVGLNINVNALLPGASPKKAKAVDNIDGQSQSQVETKKTEPTGFVEEPESNILDNKLSKQRPRIQVKRRPSTRKARKEAVRKSGIDFGEDSTDNSASIDDVPKNENQSEFTRNLENIETDETSKDVRIQEKPKEESYSTESKDSNDNEINTVGSEIKADILDSQIKTEPIRQPVKSDSTTKIVYILNDEDIFNTSAIEDPITKTNISNNERKEKDIKIPESTSSKVDDKRSEPAINTLGNTYQSTKNEVNKKSKSLFGEDETSDDDEIFRNKKPIVKSNIFDSDSEGELFGTAKKVKSGNSDKVVKEVKGSLFGDDDDDDDDLFGVKSSKRVADSQPATKTPAAVKEIPKSTEPVFEDPLSMFGED